MTRMVLCCVRTFDFYQRDHLAWDWRAGGKLQVFLGLGMEQVAAWGCGLVQGFRQTTGELQLGNRKLSYSPTSG